MSKNTLRIFQICSIYTSKTLPEWARILDQVPKVIFNCFSTFIQGTIPKKNKCHLKRVQPHVKMVENA
jgi:hypothetical protein